MQTYTFILLVIAAAITLVAVAAGAIVYLRARYGLDSLQFQLGRIGIVWVAAILLLLLGGLFFATITDWTKAGLSGAILWLRDGVFESALTYARANRIMASILLWGISLIVTLFLSRLEVFTASVGIATWTLHLWGSYAIWHEPFWLTLKAAFFVVVLVLVFDEGVFQDFPKRPHQEPITSPPPPDAHSQSSTTESIEKSASPTTHRTIWRRANTTESAAQQPAPADVLNGIIEECADTVSSTLAPDTPPA